MTPLLIFNPKKIISVTTVFVVMSLITSCGGGDDKGVPPNTPSGIVDPLVSDVVDTRVSGVVMLGPVENATVSVYELRITTSGTEKSLVSTLLDSSVERSNSKGEYTVVFKPTDAQIAIAVCASNGTYIEPASTVLAVPAEKTFLATDKLCAVTDISLEQHKSVTISYFSHMAYALAAYKIKSGSLLLDVVVPPDSTSDGLGAISVANKEVSEWLQLTSGETVNQSVITTRPQDISMNSVPLTGSAVLTNEIKYGLANVAVSELVEWIRLISPITQKSAPFNQVSMIKLAQLIFTDLGDGVIDGFNTERLFLSNTALTAHRLRYHFAFKLFMVTADTALNRTGLVNLDVNDFVQTLNNNEVFYPTGSLVALNNTVPLFTHNFPESDGVINGDTKIRIDVTDISGIKRVEMTITPVQPGITVDLPNNLATQTPTKPEWTINTVSEVTTSTPGIPDGVYNFKFVATNNKGDTSTRTVLNVIISNEGIHAHIVNPPKVVDLLQARNPVNSLAGFEAVINDIFYQESPINSTVEFSIIQTDPNFVPIVIPLKVVPFTELTPISRKYFATDAAAIGGVAENLPDGKYQLLVKAVSGKNISPLLTATPAVVDFEYDTLAPTAAFTSPDFSVFTTNSVTINTLVADPVNGINVYASGIQSQFITNAGTTIKIPLNDTQVIFDLGLPQWHVITVTAVDKAGNTTRSIPLNIAHDPTAPMVTITDGNISGNWWSKLDIDTTVTDIGSGIATVESTITGTNTAPVTNLLQDDSATPLAALKTASFTETDVQANVADGVIVYQIQATDFVTIPPLHITTAELANIGIDTTAPTINLNETVTAVNLTFPTNAWLDVSTYTAIDNPITNTPYIVIDNKNRSGSVDWYTEAVVSEPGYTPRVGTLIGTASGVIELQVGADAAISMAPTSSVSAPAIARKIPLAINIYEITASATKQIEFEAIAICVPPNKGSVLVNGNNLCDATDKDGVLTVDQNPEYVWSEILISYPDAIETSNFNTVSQFESRGALISVTARDAALKSAANGTVTGGNSQTVEACLNFQTQNAATEIPLPTGLTLDQIGADSGSLIDANLLPATGQNTNAPSTFTCDEKNNGEVPSIAGPPVVPVLDVKNAGTSNIVRCTIIGTANNTGPSRSTPRVANQTFNIEMEFVKSKGNSACP